MIAHKFMKIVFWKIFLRLPHNILDNDLIAQALLLDIKFLICCGWTWQGGSVLQSFMLSISCYSKWRPLIFYTNGIILYTGSYAFFSENLQLKVLYFSIVKFTMLFCMICHFQCGNKCGNEQLFMLPQHSPTSVQGMVHSGIKQLLNTISQ